MEQHDTEVGASDVQWEMTDIVCMYAHGSLRRAYYQGIRNVLVVIKDSSTSYNNDPQQLCPEPVVWNLPETNADGSRLQCIPSLAQIQLG